MVKLSNQYTDDNSAVLSVILLSVSLLSLVITVLGIKLRWFRHRLKLEQSEIETDSPVLLRTTSVTEFRENCARGIYRVTSGDEPLLLPNPNDASTVQSNVTPMKTNNDRRSIFKLPFRNKINLTSQSSRDENQVTTIQQAISAYPENHDNAKEIATRKKNENLKRRIYERLHSNQASTPNSLNRHEDLNPTQYRERSVDEVPIKTVQSVEEPEQFSPNVNGSNQEVNPITTFVENRQIVEENLEKRVKFETVREIENTVFETQFEIDVEDELSSSTVYSDNERYFTPPPTPYYVEEYDLPPPTPMKRKSRENSFNTPSVALQRIEPEDIEATPPTVKPRTRQIIDHTSIDVDCVSSVQTLQEQINISQQELDKESLGETEKTAMEEFDETESPETQTSLKSILKSSETSSAQKKITFHNTPQSISYKETSSSSSSSSKEDDDDVWSKVDMHRYHLNRLNIEKADVPPPLPKTPPPTEAEEKNFSFA